jgi:hypothetical protein
MPFGFGEAFGAMAGAINVLNALMKAHEQSGSSGAPASLSAFLKKMPAEALNVSRELLSGIQQLRVDCVDNKINLGQSAQENRENYLFLKEKRYRVVDGFALDVRKVTDELKLFFDDVVAIANCTQSEEILAKGFKESREYKEALERELAAAHTIEDTIKVLERHLDLVVERANKLQ